MAYEWGMNRQPSTRSIRLDFIRQTLPEQRAAGYLRMKSYQGTREQLTSMSSPSDTPGVIAPPPVLFGVVFGAAMLLNWIHSLAIPLFPSGLEWPGNALMWISALIALWATFFMGR